MGFSVSVCRSISRRRERADLWPLFAGLLRLLIAIGGGWMALPPTGSLNWLFAALALGLVLYGVMLATAVGSGVWFSSADLAAAGTLTGVIE